MQRWLSLIGTVLLASIPLAAQEHERPNIVLILADDLGYEAVGCYGGTSYRTPHLDRLASEGVRFARAYAMPLCTNTRIQLMTGKFNLRNWLSFGILDPKERTFGHLLQQAGYQTCIVGKWQLTSYDPPGFPGSDARRNTGMHPRDAGFDEYSLWHVGHTEVKGSRYAEPVIEENGKMLSNTQGRYGPDIWTDYMGDFMARHRDGPFFVYYSMALPHNPMVPTPESPEWQDPQRRRKQETRFAADMIEYTDKMVGKVVAQIEALNLRRRTLILFYSDNGTNAVVQSRMGDRIVRGGKGEVTELGIRIPAIASWQGVGAAGEVSHALVDSVDILPTLMDAAGAAHLIPEPIDGVSFLSLIKQGDQVPPPREWVLIHHDPRPGWDKDRYGLMRLAIDARFKLHEDGRLFDLIQDPFEERPIFLPADDPLMRASRIELQAVLDSTKPYPMFDPATMPRPHLGDHYADYRFEDQGGRIVIEAEQLPIPRDESWLEERHLPRYTGLGYLRAIRDQAGKPSKGQTRIAIKVKSAGLWHVALRCRSDHPLGTADNEIWLKAGDGPWRIGRVGDKALLGKWIWLKHFSSTPEATPQPLQVDLQGGPNHLWIAPRATNLKIDRIVLYQADQEEKTLDLATPMSSYNPW